MTLTGLLVDTGTVATDFFGLAAMALIGRNETDTAVAVLVVVPFHECTHPQMVTAGKDDASAAD
jgi:hypothetical protein